MRFLVSLFCFSQCRQYGSANDTGEEAALLRTAYGRPFASWGALDHKVRDWIVAAELTGKDGKTVRFQHGIRKAIAHELVKAGARACLKSPPASRIPTSSPVRPTSKTSSEQARCCPASSVTRKRARRQVSHTPKSGGHFPQECP